MSGRLVPRIVPAATACTVEDVVGPDVCLLGENVSLRGPALLPAVELTELRRRNREAWRAGEQTREDDWFTLSRQVAELGILCMQWGEEKCAFGVFEDEHIVGFVELVAVPGVIRTALLGYAIDADQQGRGFGSEAARLAVAFAFGELQVGEVQAGVRDANAASIRIVQRLGFVRGQVVPGFLNVDGVPRPHRLWRLSLEEFERLTRNVA